METNNEKEKDKEEVTNPATDDQEVQEAEVVNENEHFENENVQKIDNSEFDEFIQIAKETTSNNNDAGNENDNDNDNDNDANANGSINVNEAHKMLAASFVDLLQFITEFGIENTIFKDYESAEIPNFEAFSTKDRKHLQNAWASLIAYYKLEALFSPLLTAGIVTITCVLGAIKQAKNIKKTLPPPKSKTQAIKKSVPQLTLFDSEPLAITNPNPIKKRGRPRKNANIV